jgi:fucose 4-O-acetylase-like acetyltransferase
MAYLFKPGRPENQVSAASQRIEWIDAARGIGIILVVYGHVLGGLLAAGLVAKTNPLWLSDYTIYTFHMPLFFLIAGLNVRSSVEKGKKAFVLIKLWTVAYPYFLWSAIQGGIQLHLAGLAPTLVNHARSPLFLKTILWQPIAQFWFLYALFICHMVALFALSRRSLCLLVGGTSLLLSVFSYGQPTSYMLPFYILGIVIGDHIRRWRPSFQTTLMEAVVCTGLFAVAVHLGRTASAANATSIFSLPAALLGIGMVMLLSRAIVYASERLTKALATIGAMSMTIYILHILADSSARFVLNKLGLEEPAAELIFGLIAGVGLPMVAHFWLSRLNLLPPLGLAPWKRRPTKQPAPSAPTGRELQNVPGF